MKESVDRKPDKMINRTLTIKKSACDGNTQLWDDDLRTIFQ